MTPTCSTASPSLMICADWPLVWALEENSMISRSATLENLGWTFSLGSTKCSISAMVNSLQAGRVNVSLLKSSYCVVEDVRVWGFWIPDTDESRARRDLVPEGVSDLSGSEGKFSLVELQQPFEVEEHPLSCLGPQVAANSQLVHMVLIVYHVWNRQLMCCHRSVPGHVPAWSDGRLEHQVEGDGRCEVVSCRGRLDVVLHKELGQLLLAVVVHLSREQTVTGLYVTTFCSFRCDFARVFCPALTWVITSSISAAFSAEHFSSDISFFKWAVRKQTAHLAAATVTQSKCFVFCLTCDTVWKLQLMIPTSYCFYTS